MKHIIALVCFSFLLTPGKSQTSYYKGEWTTLNSAELFTGVFRIVIGKDNTVNGTLVWTYLAIDSSKSDLVDLYKGKKGKKGIEYVQGTYNPSTREIAFEGYKKDDPYEVIGTDKYTLKLSSDRNVLYGTTYHDGGNDAYFYALKTDRSVAEKQINEARRLLNKKMN